MRPRPEAHIRLEALDGRIIERTLRDVSLPLVDEDGWYRTANGGRANQSSRKFNIHSAWMPPGTVF